MLNLEQKGLILNKKIAMNDYLIDRETLSKFVDELIKNKTLPVATAEGLDDLRETAIKDLDNQIGTAIFSQFTEAQDEEYHQLLAREDATEQDFADFFAKIGLDVEQTITDTMQGFAKEFIGGQNG